jgi:alkyl hydroperoxide reductase subunit F
MYDVIIIGGGPAGVAAGGYASRKQMRAALVAESIGGQSAVSATIENWIGDVSISGMELAQKLEKHLRAQEGIDIRVSERAVLVEKSEGGFRIVLGSGEAMETKALILALGSRHRHLNVPGEEEFTGKGVGYCSTCDAPFFRGKDVAVVGAGNSGLEACQDLFPYAEKIYLVSNTGELGGDEALREEVKSHPKVEIVFHAKAKEILGEMTVSGFRYEDSQTGEERTLDVGGVFVEIGMMPNTDLVKNLVEQNEWGEIVIDHRTCATSEAGVFAAGDVADVAYRQNNIAAGQGAIAAISAYDFVKKSTK